MNTWVSRIIVKSDKWPKVQEVAETCARNTRVKGRVRAGDCLEIHAQHELYEITMDAHYFKQVRFRVTGVHRFEDGTALVDVEPFSIQ